jgi:hypothetical protein
MIKRNRPRSGGMKMNRPHQNGYSNPNQNAKHDDRNEVRLKNRNYYQQMYEKYSVLARESLSLGDRVEAEGYFQYAEHYLRQLNDRIRYDNEVQQNQQQRFAAQQAAERQNVPAAPPAMIAAESVNSEANSDNDSAGQVEGDATVSASSEKRAPRRRMIRTPHRRHTNTEAKTTSAVVQNTVEAVAP